MSSGKYNTNIEQGTVYGFQLTLYDDTGAIYDLTDFTGQMQIRDKVGGTVLYDTDIYQDLVIDGPTGRIFVSIPTARTELFNFNTGVYDLELKKDNEVTRLIEGSVYLSKEVTK